jgi:hypothetical protein
MACDFPTVFGSLAEALSGANNFEKIYTLFASSLIDQYPTEKDAIIAAAKQFNIDYEYEEQEGGKRKSRRNRLKKSRRNRKQ